MSRRVVTVITAITKERIVIGEFEFLHAKKHFPMLPDDMLLELQEIKRGQTMKRGEVFFHPMEGSGQLSISWSSAPRGASVEAKKGNGVGFFSSNGNLLSVIFDDVTAEEDHQILEFKKYKIYQ